MSEETTVDLRKLLTTNQAAQRVGITQRHLLRLLTGIPAIEKYDSPLGLLLPPELVEKIKENYKPGFGLGWVQRDPAEIFNDNDD